eukprot:125416_1
MAVNISALHGIRCLCCLWVMLRHGYELSAVFPLSSPVWDYMHQVPIIGWFVQSNVAVDVFWIMSGFLCEYQLHTQVDTHKPLYYIWFMINRILRLWPLYLPNVFVNFLSPLIQGCSTWKDLFLALFFVEMPFSERAFASCGFSGWTLNADFQGYVVIVMLFVLLGTNRYKKYILILWFVVSTLHLIASAIQHDIHYPWRFGGIELNELDINWIPHNVLSICKSYFILPSVDDRIVSMEQRKFMGYYSKIYFSTIDKHGGTVFLGSLLCINLLSQKKQKYSTLSLSHWVKLMVFVVLYCLVHELRRGTFGFTHPFWVVFHDRTATIAFYLMLDFILSVVNTVDAEHLSVQFIRLVLENRIVKFISKFTFAIYLNHVLVIMYLVYTIGPMPCDVGNGGVGEDGYGYCYLMKLITMVWCLSFVLAIGLHYVLEYPMQLVRYSYVQSKYIQRKKQH